MAAMPEPQVMVQSLRFKRHVGRSPSNIRAGLALFRFRIRRYKEGRFGSSTGARSVDGVDQTAILDG
jgi:hypothetical protein